MAISAPWRSSYAALLPGGSSSFQAATPTTASAA